MQANREPVEAVTAVCNSNDGQPEQQTNQQFEARAAELQQCENILQKAKDAKLSYVEQGKILLRICDGQLYKAKNYTSFETYCHAEWGFTRQWAYKLIQAFETVEKLPPGMEKPKNERQARALRRQQGNGGSAEEPNEGSEQNPNGTPPKNPQPGPRSEKEQLFYDIEELGMDLNILLRKLTSKEDQDTGLGRIAPIREWINMVEAL